MNANTTVYDDKTIKASPDDFAETAALPQGNDHDLDQHDAAQEAPTTILPEVAKHQALSEAPTSLIDPTQVEAQTADTETMAPITDAAADSATPNANDGHTVAMPTSSETSIAPTTALPQSSSEIATDSNAGNENDTVAMPFAKAYVPLVDTEESAANASDNTGTADANTGNSYNSANTANAETASDNADEPLKAEAWQQQQQAAQEYAEEAHRNSYPGSGTTAQATYQTQQTAEATGAPYASYPGWNQYTAYGANTTASEPNTNATNPYLPRVEYKKGPNAATIVWGVCLALLAFGALASTWMTGFSAAAWSILAITVLVLLGLTLIIGGIVSAVRRKRPQKAQRAQRPGRTK